MTIVKYIGLFNQIEQNKMPYRTILNTCVEHPEEFPPVDSVSCSIGDDAEQVEIIIDFASAKTDFSTAHPLLIYAELLYQGGSRELETARIIYDMYLEQIFDRNGT